MSHPLPPPGSRVHRQTARVLPVDPAGRVLLLHGWDPDRANDPFWFTIGGAAEGDETMPAAAARELAEETGIVINASTLGDPISTSTIEFSWGGYEIVQSQTFYAVAVDTSDVSSHGQDCWERATIDGHGWWSADELEASGDAAHPDIPDLIRRAAASTGPPAPTDDNGD